MPDPNARPSKRFRRLTDEDLLSLKEEHLSATKARSNPCTSKPPSGRKRTRDGAERLDSSARKRRAPTCSSPTGTPEANRSFKRRKFDDLDTDVQMVDAAQSPDLSTHVSGSARKASHRRKSAKDVLRESRRRGTAVSSSSANPSQPNPRSTNTAHTSSTPSASTHHSCQQGPSYVSSTDHVDDTRHSYCGGASSTINTNPQRTQTASTGVDAPSAASYSKAPVSNFYTDEICELDVSTGAYDEKPEEIPDSRSGAPDAPTLEYFFPSHNQLLLNIKYGTSRRVGVVVDIPSF